MTLRLSAIAASILLALSGNALAQGSQGKQSGNDSAQQRIEEQHRAAVEQCGSLKDNAKDICKAEADGRKEVAEAELKVQQNGTPKNRFELAETKAKADYDVAKQRCDDQVGDKKSACEKEAQAARDNALAQAKRQSQEGGSASTGASSPAAAPK